MKQRRHLSNKISAAYAASILSISLTGITCGSFAWFTYMTRAKIEEFRGVAIGFGDLQAGIISDLDLPDASEHGLIRDDSYDDKTIYWFEGHEASSETIRYYLGQSGYATDTLYPVTTRKYSNNDSFKLYSEPDFYNHQSEDLEADHAYSIFLPLVFRYEDILEEGTYISDENIYLSQVKLDTPVSQSHIYEAVRIHTDNKNQLAHLINPSSSDDGKTDVGGVLDLNGDGFYDTRYVGDERYEYIYGQFKESNYKVSPESDDTIVYPDQRTTFNAGHKAGTYALDSLIPEVAEYEGIYDFRNKHKPVTITNPLNDNLAFLDLSIFVEGWDLHVVDSEIDMPFSMDLEFGVEI